MQSTYRTIGIVGGGQLARMSAQAAQQMGYQVVILDSDPNCPAAQVTNHRVSGRFDDLAALKELASKCDVITLEHEWVNPAHFNELEAAGHEVFPSSLTLAILTDKLNQRLRLLEAGLPGPLAAPAPNRKAAKALAAEWGYPIVLKARHGGYDGYGVQIVHDEEQFATAFPPDSEHWYAEQYVPYDRELAVMVARGRDGQIAVYPVVESVQTVDGHRCDTVTVPSPGISEAAILIASQTAIAAVEAVRGVGLFGVEMFLTSDGDVLVNEIAPRPHNSGHYTMDCCATSQFEQHIRAVCGLPLGPARLLAGGAAMANLLGARTGTFSAGAAIRRALRAVPAAHVHWYGKAETRAGRKMGHINVIGDHAEIALADALKARAAFWNEDANG